MPVAATGSDSRSAVAHRRIAIIDIGSNSVRLVVYDGPARSPAVLFNEKVMAGLGSGLGARGRLSERSMEVAVATLARYARLARAMHVESVRAVATAAVRRASNGPEFAARVTRETGLAVEIIDGATEAQNSAYGVLAGIPDADGVIGDLGGGSLELARVAGGEVHERASLPLGALRLTSLHQQGRSVLKREIDAALRQVGWAQLGQGKPFYAVGGSWRALTHLHMHLLKWPLPVVHQYRLTPEDLDRLLRSLAQMSAQSLRAVPEISSGRIPQLPGTAALLRAVRRCFGSNMVISSAYGLREGLLFAALPGNCRAGDPLLAAARDCACREGRFANGGQDFAADAIGEALLTFSDGLFRHEAPRLRRLRHVACLLADTSWRAHPDMRAEDAMDRALHGTWVGIEADERAMLANALWAVNGGSPGRYGNLLLRLAQPDQLQLAHHWGLALRLGQRLCAGVPELLTQARLELDSGQKSAGKAATLWLSLPEDQAMLYGKPVQRRHQALARALAVQAELRLHSGASSAPTRPTARSAAS